MKDIETTVIEFVKFVFHRFDPSCSPTDEQLQNALHDFRKLSK